MARLHGGEDSPDDISRGLLAGEVGSLRLVKLFECLTRSAARAAG